MTQKTSYLPAFKQKNIPIIFASDDNYSIYLGVCIKSLIENSNTNNNYDILILDGGINDIHKKKILFLQKKNISIRFVDITNILKKYDSNIFFLNLQFTLAAYYRLFLPEIFLNYNKVIYLDCDMIIVNDIAELLKTEINNEYIAATQDMQIIIDQKKNFSETEYYYKILKMKNCLNYFNSGCMICNLKKMREDNLTEKLIKRLIEIKYPRYADQCVLNSVCEGNVKFILSNWNYTCHITINTPNYTKYFNKEQLQSFNKAKDFPYIIHFTAMGKKPWINPSIEKAEYFWFYARQSPFYEEILYKNFNHTVIDTSIIKDVFHHTKNKIRYWRYKLLSKITFGNMRKHYKSKKKELKERIRQVRRFLKGK